MAKIDVQKIAGFDSMTPEEKIAALQGFDFPDPDYSGYVKKDLYDKAASEVQPAHSSWIRAPIHASVCDNINRYKLK